MWVDGFPVRWVSCEESIVDGFEVQRAAEDIYASDLDYDTHCCPGICPGACIRNNRTRIEMSCGISPPSDRIGDMRQRVSGCERETRKHRTLDPQ